MSGRVRYLTKSRFKLAAECPRKLFYTGKPEYLDRSLDDTFLAALAEGGYQVGALACSMYPGGISVDSLDYQVALDQTATLLTQERVVVFEAALAIGSLFVRVDILRKDGRDVEIIEVKAKSYDATTDGDFRGKKGQLTSGFLPYLKDVAFQRYVVERAMPESRVRAFLLLVDKKQRSTVDGLNQRFRAVRGEDGRLRIDVTANLAPADLGQSLLIKIAVDDQVDQILKGQLSVTPSSEKPFDDAVNIFADAYAKDQPLPPIPSSACSSCQFKAGDWPGLSDLRSGFHECWSQAFGWGEADFSDGTILDLWNYRGKDKLLTQRILKPKQVTLEHLDFDGAPPSSDGMSHKHRQWYACTRSWPGGGDFFFDGAGYRSVSSAWRFPLHCIDFETSAVAIPFVKGRRPYETTAFQFSHHTIDQSGRIEHRSQWLCREPGVDPNVGFVRALRTALVGDDGTIFRWSHHENTVLNKICEQMLEAEDPPADQQALVGFIESITTRSSGAKNKVVGRRAMVDLCDIAEKYYFHPSTKGSNSLKKVLPALMRSSSFLRDEYGSIAYGGHGISLNFGKPVAWWQMRDGVVMDPYILLPPVFVDIPRAEVEAAEEGLSPELREGGAAMAAYARLQFEDLSQDRREAIECALLKYCELDTLAMVMAVQAWTAWSK